MTLAAIAYADRKEIPTLLANQQFATQGRWQLQWLGMDEVTGTQSRVAPWPLCSHRICTSSFLQGNRRSIAGP